MYDVEIKRVDFDENKKTVVSCCCVPESIVLALIEKYGHLGNCIDIAGVWCEHCEGER